MDHVTASAETLVRQASMVADEYMGEAVRRIDARFGAGYALDNPALIAAFMSAAAQDFSASLAAAVRQDETVSLGAISDSLDRVAEAIANHR